MGQQHSAYGRLSRSNSDIRVLEILPSANPDEIVQVKVSQKGVGEALGTGFVPFSYVWGDASIREDIVAQGMTVSVTKNLAIFLRYARNFVLPNLQELFPKARWYKGKIRFWADAICINQADLDERNWQVTLMNRIYSYSPHVLCWLGIIEDSHLASQLFNTIYENCGLKEAEKRPMMQVQQNARLERDFNFEDWMSKHPEFWEEDCEDDVKNRYWNAALRVLRSEFWGRIWIFQEVVLPGCPVLMSGSDFIDFDAILATYAWMITYTRLKNPSIPDKAKQILPKILPRYNRLTFYTIYKIRTANRKMNDLRLVGMTQHLQATDARDKIYGLMALLYTKLKPDYRKPIEEVYSDFCSKWLKEIGDLEFLFYSGLECSSSTLRLPSWIPDWQERSKIYYPPLFSAERKMTNDVIDRSRPRFDKELAPEIVQTKTGSLLVVQAIVWDEVTHVFPLPDDYYELAAALRECLAASIKTYGSATLKGPKIHVFQALFRTAFKGWLPPIPKMVHSIAINFLAMVVLGKSNTEPQEWDEMFSNLGLSAGSDFAQIFIDQVVPGVPEAPQIDEWRTAHDAMAYESKNRDDKLFGIPKITFYRRQLFLTQTGYLGLSGAPSKGDLVTKFHGLSTPVLLRNFEGPGFKYVGPSFVVGLMKGAELDKAHKSHIHRWAIY